MGVEGRVSFWSLSFRRLVTSNGPRAGWVCQVAISLHWVRFGFNSNQTAGPVQIFIGLARLIHERVTCGNLSEGEPSLRSSFGFRGSHPPAPHWPSPSSRVRFAVALSLYSSLLPPARESYTRSLLRFPLSSRFASRLCDRQGLRRTRRRPGIHRRESFALPCRKPGYIPTLTFSGPRITGITSLSPFNGGKSWILWSLAMDLALIYISPLCGVLFLDLAPIWAAELPDACRFASNVCLACGLMIVHFDLPI